MRRSKISFLLEREEIELLEKILYLEPGLSDRVQGARKERGKYRVIFFEENFQEALDALSFQAGWIQLGVEEDKQRMLNLCEKIRGYSLLSLGNNKSLRIRKT